MPGSTMCVCGDMQTLVDELPNRTGNVFMPHTDRRTGKPCEGMPLNIPFTPLKDPKQGRGLKKLFATYHGDCVWVCIVPKTLYDYAMTNKASGIQVDVDSSIRLEPADFEQWLADMVTWWDAEKAKINEQPA